MTTAITQKFLNLKEKGEKAFIPFVTAGDPDLPATVEIVLEMARSGADLVELGVPFSDPLADGPTIQRSSERALRHGYRMADILDAVRAIRRASDIPLVLFSYFNPIYQYGLEALARDARAAGIDGVLATDLTPEEGVEYRARLEDHGLDPVFLVAPTSESRRVERICSSCRGFVYLVSTTGVTGVRQALSDSIRPTLERIRRCSDLPVAVGFGISRPEHVREVWAVADAAVVGSAIVAAIGSSINTRRCVSEAGELCRWLTGRNHARA